MSGAMPVLQGAMCGTESRELFELEKMTPSEVAQAKAICRACPVEEECQVWAVAHEEFFFRGGMTEAERKRERRRQGITLMRPERIARYSKKPSKLKGPKHGEATNPSAISLDLPHLDIYVAT